MKFSNGSGNIEVYQKEDGHYYINSDHPTIFIPDDKDGEFILYHSNVLDGKDHIEIINKTMEVAGYVGV